MGYIVTARKWRPQRFEEIVGQDHVSQTLKNAIATGRIAHAYLFAGTRGVGKTTTARILAKALNCLEGPTPTPCNKCSVCREISQGNSIDVLEIDGASNRGIDEVRELRENIKYMPAQGRFKIYIIDEVHMLTKEAFNALLKTLEEPPSHVIFILATTEPHKIPTTILSRCQRFHLKLVAIPDIVDRLELIAQEEGIKIGKDSLLQIARRAQGSMRDAQSFLDLVVSYAGQEIKKEDIEAILGGLDLELIYAMVESIAERNPSRILELTRHLSHDQHSLKEFCYEFADYLRNLIVFKIAQTPERFIPWSQNDLARIKNQSQKFTFEELTLLFNILLEFDKDIRLVSTPQVFLEITLVKMALIKPVLPIEDIIDRLETLERQLSSTDSQPQMIEPKPYIQQLPSEPKTPILNIECNNLEYFWDQVKKIVAQRNNLLAPFLDHMVPKELCDEYLLLELDKRYEFYFKNAPVKTDYIKKAIHELTGKMLELKFQLVENKEEDDLGFTQTENNQTDIIKEVLEIFGGQIVSR
jgi:DNA polymerase-3 subunit gamma/tau